MGSRLKPRLVSYTPEEFTFEFEAPASVRGLHSKKEQLDPTEILGPGETIAIEGPEGIMMGDVKHLRDRRRWLVFGPRIFRGVAVRPKQQ